MRNRADAPDVAGFEVFVQVSGRSLLRTALLITGDRGHAEDVLQDSLVRVAQRWPAVRHSPEGYARRVVINRAIDHVRRRRFHLWNPGGSEAIDVPVPDSSDALGLREGLVSALRELPLRQRSVVVCRYVYDLDERQTADVLGVSVGTVKSSASRGLHTLRRLLPKFSDDDNYQEVTP